MTGMKIVSVRHSKGRKWPICDDREWQLCGQEHEGQPRMPGLFA